MSELCWCWCLNKVINTSKKNTQVAGGQGWRARTVLAANFEQHFWSKDIHDNMFHRWLRLNRHKYSIKRFLLLQREAAVSGKIQETPVPGIFFLCLAFNKTSGPLYTTCSATSCQHQHTEIRCSGRDALLLSPFTAQLFEGSSGSTESGTLIYCLH